MTAALIVACLVAAGALARLAQEHHALRAAQIAVTAVVSWTRRRARRRFTNTGTRVLGRDTLRTTPIRHAREAAA